jgi:hypothetical protein
MFESIGIRAKELGVFMDRCVRDFFFFFKFVLEKCSSQSCAVVIKKTE